MDHYIKANSVELIQSGEHYFNTCCELIESAKQEIHLQTYILAEDNTGKKITEALLNAAKRGIKITLLIDGYGSKELSSKFIRSIIDAGIRFRFFGSFFSSESISRVRRLHHKILVIDKRKILIGGINIGDHYHGTMEKPAWLDFAVLIEGSCGEMIHRLCEMIYQKKNYNWENKKCDLPAEGVEIRFRRNDWLRGKSEVYHSYKSAIRQAKKSITIVGCYFMPGFNFLQSLKRAVRRGVKVKVIMGSVSDIPLFHNAEKYLYDFLLRNNIEIYEWGDSVLHGKAAVIDSSWSTIGSYNLNNLSKYKTIELNVDIRDKQFSTGFHEELEEIMQTKCTRVLTSDHKKKTNIFSRMKNGLAYFYYRIFMVLISSRE
jgi:cardiolipin synthase